MKLLLENLRELIRLRLETDVHEQNERLEMFSCPQVTENSR